jgi:hypothetical protein
MTLTTRLFRISHIILTALGMLALVERIDAAGILYGSTAAGGAGELYILNPANGAVVQDIGALNDLSGLNYGITGLAFNPFTGVLYGSTGNNNPATAAQLVAIDPLTARVTVIGAFNAGNAGNPATMSDIGFDPRNGSLYGIGSIGGPQLYSINPLTGKATVIGNTGLTSTTGGGLAISSGGTFFGTPTAARFGTYNPVTGAYANITSPVLPIGGAYAALDFDGNVLYGLDLGNGSPPPSHLVTIDPTGAVTDLGPSVISLDAIAFRSVPEPSTIGLILCSGVIGLVINSRRRK